MSKEAYESAGLAVESSLHGPVHPLVLTGARLIDARGIRENSWILALDGRIEQVGQGRESLESALRAAGLPSLPPSFQPGSDTHDVNADGAEFIDAASFILTPGFIDIHSHGGWVHSFDDGEEAIRTARACHMVHGTTRQVLSLITNPVDTMCTNLRSVKRVMDSRPDVLGAHLEGPFIALSRKGAHDPKCLRDPEPAVLDNLLEAADGCIRQVTLAPERDHGYEAISRLAESGVVPAVGHCDADYDQTRRAFDAGARILTHVFNAMNGIHHRQPGPIPAAVEDRRVTAELINDGFHVQDPCVDLAFRLFPHRIALVTDAMEATGCEDGAYKLGSLDVIVKGGHARLTSNGAIAGSTLTLDVAVGRAIQAIGLPAPQAVEAATLTPARALGLDRSNPITGAPLGLLAPGYAADLLLLNPADWSVKTMVCNGHRIQL
ncbi:N-acetylglucosamine-6-phosphate deacetylase [Bifidobacterium polysaccharolyticum]|uniref:N-acetylglucosamine-6-phosphate deacetylase n=1 Tax=Bifidobacterium polysaccharolyticum TaxID=2750967 RepID=UPI0018DB6143|nr:N-acetylglucosamine-6-phosphate deacetylase [Bifidobacterium polysaccharolyticum]MBI0065006.1 N-acetylglucosamine-6-phosphate deacetylase [Bifidobacterium polysaccharolyticum]